MKGKRFMQNGEKSKPAELRKLQKNKVRASEPPLAADLNSSPDPATLDKSPHLSEPPILYLQNLMKW